MIRLPEIKTAELSTYGNFAQCHQAHFHISCVGLGTRLLMNIPKIKTLYSSLMSRGGWKLVTSGMQKSDLAYVFD